MFDEVLTMPMLSSWKFQTILSITVFGVKIIGFVKL